MSFSKFDSQLLACSMLLLFFICYTFLWVSLGVIVICCSLKIAPEMAINFLRCFAFRTVDFYIYIFFVFCCAPAVCENAFQLFNTSLSRT